MQAKTVCSLSRLLLRTHFSMIFLERHNKTLREPIYISFSFFPIFSDVTLYFECVEVEQDTLLSEDLLVVETDLLVS